MPYLPSAPFPTDRLSDKQQHSQLAFRIWIFAACLLTISSGASCSNIKAPRYPTVDYAAYEHIQGDLPAKVVRAITTLPMMKSKFHHGNWGGQGSYGGKPIDAMDEIFRRHDISYDLANSITLMRQSDKITADHLSQLDTTDLSSNANKFRLNAIKFFRSPLSRVLGKPVRAFFCREEHPNGLFADGAYLEEFLNPNTPVDKLKYCSEAGLAELEILKSMPSKEQKRGTRRISSKKYRLGRSRQFLGSAEL